MADNREDQMVILTSGRWYEVIWEIMLKLILTVLLLLLVVELVPKAYFDILDKK